MRKYALMASAVVASEEFISMSYKAQALYIQILCETETNGEVVNIARVVRATGICPEALEELYASGFLLRVGGTTVVRHQWCNNKYTAKAWQSMEGLKPYRDGLLVFEDAEGHSAYCLGDTEETPEAHPTDTEEHSNSNGTCTGTGNPNDNDNPNGNEQSQGEWESEGRGEDLHPCWCPRCQNTKAQYWSKDHRTWIRCPDCGEFENRREGGSEGCSPWNE